VIMRPQSHDDSPKAPCGCGGAPAPRAVAPCGPAEPASSRSVPQAVDPEPDASGAFPIAGFASGQDSRPSGVRPVPIAPARNPPGRAPEPIPDPERLGETGVEVWVAKHQLLFKGRDGGALPMSHGLDSHPNPFGRSARPSSEPVRVRHTVPDCSQAPISVRVEDVERLRGLVCAIDLGTTSDPSVSAGPYGPGRLRAVLPTTFEPGTAAEPLSAIVALFPDLLPRRAPLVEMRPNVQGRRMTPGLFWPIDRYHGVVGLALRIIFTFPEILRPVISLGHCRTSALDLANFAARVNIRSGQPVWGNPVIADRQGLFVNDGILTGVRVNVRAQNPNQPSYVAVNPPPGQRVYIAPVVDLDCAMADYLFWFAHRLRVWATRFPGFSPIGETLIDPITWSVRRDWYALMSDLCARLAMMHTMRVGALLVHEMLHDRTRFHCGRNRRARSTGTWINNQNFACCQDRAQMASFETTRALFGLPSPVGLTAATALSFVDPIVPTSGAFGPAFFAPPPATTLTSGCDAGGTATATLTALHTSFLERRHCVRITTAVVPPTLCGGQDPSSDAPFCFGPPPPVRIGSELDWDRQPDPSPPEPIRPDRLNPIGGNR
jgi:hypothetical protein